VIGTDRWRSVIPGGKTTNIEPHLTHVFPTAERLWSLSTSPPLGGTLSEQGPGIVIVVSCRVEEGFCHAGVPGRCGSDRLILIDLVTRHGSTASAHQHPPVSLKTNNPSSSSSGSTARGMPCVISQCAPTGFITMVKRSLSPRPCSDILLAQTPASGCSRRRGMEHHALSAQKSSV
jgi:hypothetical protein